MWMAIANSGDLKFLHALITCKAGLTILQG